MEVLRAAGLLEEQAGIAAHLAVRQGAAERLEAELPDELVGARGVGRRLGLAGDQSVLVAASKGRPGEPLGRLAVGFRLERRDPLPLQLVLEPVDEVLFREAAGGLGLIAEQVAHGVVVLAVRQATHGQRLQAAPIGPGDPLPCLADLLVGKAGQVVDPAQQHGFLVAARLDPLAAGVLHSLRRLPQQQRLLGVPPIDQIHQRESERRDLVTARVGLGEFEPRLGGHAVVAVAPLALDGVQHGVHLLDEERLIHCASRLRGDARSECGEHRGDHEGRNQHRSRPSPYHRLPPTPPVSGMASISGEEPSGPPSGMQTRGRHSWPWTPGRSIGLTGVCSRRLPLLRLARFGPTVQPSRRSTSGKSWAKSSLVGQAARAASRSAPCQFRSSSVSWA